MFTDSDRQAIIDRLSAKYGDNLINRCLSEVEWARQGYKFNHRIPRRHQRPTNQAAEIVAEHINGELTLKIWPIVGLSAIGVDAGGAWRIWVLARHIDQDGDGRVCIDRLFDYCKTLQIDERNRRRWITQAVELGLFQRSKHYFYLAGLARGALILGCQTIGKPVFVSPSAMVRRGWRGHVWAAFLATLNAPMSQLVKEQVTGVSDRVQRNYQKAVAPGIRVKNYCERGKAVDGRADGLRSSFGWDVFTTHGKVIQRLPDRWQVLPSLAKRGVKGRSRKAQKIINTSCLEARRKDGDILRLFHEQHGKAAAAIKRWSHSDGDRPTEIFEGIPTRSKRVALWQPLEVSYAI